MLLSVVECVVSTWLRVCWRVCLWCRRRRRMFHVKQFEGDG